jgi:hypothetical protein
MYFYSDKKLEDLLADIYLTRATARPYERFDLLDTADFAHAAAAVLIYMQNDRLHLSHAGRVYTQALPAIAKLPIAVNNLRKSPMKDHILAISADPLSESTTVSLAVSTCSLSIDGDNRSWRIIQRRSANSISGYLYELQGEALPDELLAMFKAAGLRISNYEAYILHAFIYNKIPREGNMKEKEIVARADTPAFNDVLLNQLDLMQYALLDFNQTGSMAAIEKLNDSIFNFYVLYYGRHNGTEGEGLEKFVTAVSELIAEITVFDSLLRHIGILSTSWNVALRESVTGDRERAYTAMKAACADFEKENVIAEMRSYLRTLEPEPEVAYGKYCGKQAERLLHRFVKEHKRLKQKRSAKRYNSFYEALANICMHMDILGFYAATEDFNELRHEMKKYLEAMEDYSSRLNMKVLMKAYQQELALESDEVKSIGIPKAGRKELKKLLKGVSAAVEKLKH